MFRQLSRTAQPQPPHAAFEELPREQSNLERVRKGEVAAAQSGHVHHPGQNRAEYQPIPCAREIKK